MFTHLFENRNPTIASLIKLGDFLGRSLRENLTLFSIEGEMEKVVYLTESNKIISGNFLLDPLTLKNIEVLDADLFQDGQLYENYVNQKINGLVTSLYSDKYGDASVSLTELLSIWENRLKYDNLQSRLLEKSSRLQKTHKIVESDEFKRFLEITPNIAKFLKENKKELSKIDEIQNAINLAHVITLSFNLPKVGYEDLNESEYVVEEKYDTPIYDIICQQELIKKELLEAKQSFDTIWVTNSKIKNLAGMVYESDEAIIDALHECLCEIPYLALVSKKTLTETFSNALSMSNTEVTKDITKFASKIFEMKKPVRVALVEHLNDKYGINLLNLKDPPSFQSLLNTQVVIFEALGKISPRKSVQKKVLFEVARMLRGKSGVESLDVTMALNELFQKAELSEFIAEGVMSTNKYHKIDFAALADDMEQIGNVLRDLKHEINQLPDEGGGMEGMGDEMGGEEMPPEEGMEGEEMPPEEGMGDEGQDTDLGDDYEDPSAEMGAGGPEEGMPPEEGMEGEEMGGEEMGGEEMGAEMPPEESEMDQEVPEEEMEVAPEQDELPSKEEIIQNLSDLESLVQSIAKEVGIESPVDDEMDDEIPQDDDEDVGDVVQNDPDDDYLDDEEDKT